MQCGADVPNLASYTKGLILSFLLKNKNYNFFKFSEKEKLI